MAVETISQEVSGLNLPRAYVESLFSVFSVRLRVFRGLCGE
jgi:hypothetical protein